MSIVIAMMNQKGGVGKTTLTINLGKTLAALGYDVAMIDLDPQGHVCFQLALTNEHGDPPEGVFNMLVQDMPPIELLLDVPVTPTSVQPAGKLKLLPGHTRTATAGFDMQLRGHDYSVLAEKLSALPGFDYVLIDTAPTVSLFTPAILNVADYVLIPTQLHRLSLDGIFRSVQTMTNLVKFHTAEVLGVLPTRTRLNTLEEQERLEELVQTYEGLVWTELSISESIIWSEASDMAMAVTEYQPSHKAAQEMWAVTERVIKSTEGIAV